MTISNIDRTYSLGGVGPLTIEDQRIIGFGTKWPLLEAIIRDDRRDACLMRDYMRDLSGPVLPEIRRSVLASIGLDEFV